MPSAVYQLRKEAGLCTRCGIPAADDSQFCLPHLEAHRAHSRRWKARATKRWRKLKLCTSCGNRRSTGNTTCMACQIERRRLSLALRATLESAVENPVDKTERITAATRSHPDGRIRYHGQQKRGSQPTAQLDDQDIGFARSALVAGESGLKLYDSEEARALPRIQREDVKAAALAHIARAQGHLEDVLERRGHFKARHGRRDGDR